MDLNQNTIENTELTSIFNKDQIDVFTLNKIEMLKSNFLLSINSSPLKELQDNLPDLLSEMKAVLTKYFYEEYPKYKVIYDRSYNFDMLEELAGTPNLDKELIRRVASTAMQIYDHFVKKLGVEIPLIRTDIKKN